MRFGPDPVKHSAKLAKTGPKWSRWLEGWGLLIPSVGVATLAACLALPQGTMPDYLPLPILSRQELDQARTQWFMDASAARQHPLAYDVRALGESFRMLGRLAHGTEALTVERRARFRNSVEKVRSQLGPAPLAQLRAVQGQLFLMALAAWEQSGLESDELIELGGDFIRIAVQLGWIEAAADTSPSQSPRALRLSEDERLALFVTRWNDLAGIQPDATLRLAPVWSLLALRARLRLPLARLDARDFALIKRVQALSPSYPGRLSEGLLNIRLGHRGPAVEALQEHLQMHPNGEYLLRARNHLQFALEHLPSDGL